MRYLLAVSVLSLAACGHSYAPAGPAYVCYPVDATPPAPDAGDYCQSVAPDACALGDISRSTGPGPVWCCVEPSAGTFRCCE